MCQHLYNVTQQVSEAASYIYIYILFFIFFMVVNIWKREPKGHIAKRRGAQQLHEC